MELPVEVKEETLGNGRDKTRTSKVRVPTAMLGGEPEGTNSDDKTRTDPSASMEATRVQHFTEMVVNDRTHVKVSEYRGQWRRLDSQVSGRNAEIRAGCFGPVFGGGNCDRRQTKIVGTPSNGTWYKLTPAWSGQWVQVADTLYHQCGVIDITLVRGGSTWDFWFNVCQGTSAVSF